MCNPPPSTNKVDQILNHDDQILEEPNKLNYLGNAQIPKRIEQIDIDSDDSDEYLPGHRVDDPNSNIVAFFTFDWHPKCDMPNENAKTMINQMYMARTGPIEKVKQNEWRIGLDPPQKVTLKILRGVPHEQLTQAFVCPIDNYYVDKNIQKQFGRKIQTDLDEFIVNLKKEEKMFKIGAVIAQRFRNGNNILLVNVPPKS